MRRLVPERLELEPSASCGFSPGTLVVAILAGGGTGIGGAGVKGWCEASMKHDDSYHLGGGRLEPEGLEPASDAS